MTMESDPRLVPLATGVHVWSPNATGAWGLANCGLLTAAGEAALVDTPYTLDRTDDFLAAARTAAGPGAGITTVLTTHGNGDHGWGNQRVTGAEIVSTRRTLEHQCFEPTPEQLRSLVEDTDPGEPLGWYFRRHFGRFDFRGITVQEPTRTFEGRLDLRIGDMPVELHDVGPAHTVGDMVVHLPEQRIVFAGDVVFAGDHVCHWSGPLERVVLACERVLGWNPDLVVPGHGPVLDQDGLRGHIAYLRDLADQARSLHARGLTPTEAARHLIAEDRYPDLHLPERMVITLASEFRHLDRADAEPDILALMTDCSWIAWQRDGGDQALSTSSAG
ncbi:MBL fold metallo-hydrolase [Streptomyces spectabilis]|uniref:MBL fold metallo-hydrolase n=2 Tax=Streptomyces spectabilis TaxID=68270 RepID=A0A516R2H7_STRST|nr:MBL fold metallo-hydrolase [Streptomyces spectabilis]